MSKLAKALTAAAGNAGGDNLYVEDVFSTYLYDGTGAAHTITNGIDLDGEGGLTWIKTRNTGTSAWHSLSDTERGAGYILRSDLTNAQNFDTAEFTSFNSDGFTVGNDTQTNGSGRTYASFTFRKAEKWFTALTYTGTGVDPMSVPHNLGVTPGCVIIKRTDTTADWQVMFPGLIADGYGGTGRMRLNTTAAYAATGWTSIADSTHITIPTNLAEINASGGTYVAYLFASDAGGFGDDGSESIIKCGTFTTDGTQTAEVTGLGWEPQYVLFKNVNLGNNWQIHDSMRGMPWGSYTYLAANSSGAEVSGAAPVISPTPDGFLVNNANYDQLSIYIAIRRPMKTPESGTEVFSPSTYAGNDPTPTVITTGFPVDLALTAYRDLANAGAFGFTPRLTEAYLYSATTAAEVATGLAFDSNTSFATDANHWNQSPSNLIGYGFKRATGFMDVVAYTGDGVSGRQIPHNLKVTPELAFTKQRSGDANTNWWNFYYPTGQVRTFNNNAFSNWGITASSTWFEGDPSLNNASTKPFVAYLFATLDGVSKVGSYTGTGADLNVDCGFSAGARFILIKRSDSTGDWYVWDSERGIVAGNDPYLLLNSTAAEVTSTDYIDPLSSGFTVTSSAPAALNASGGTYIFLAIA